MTHDPRTKKHSLLPAAAMLAVSIPALARAQGSDPFASSGSAPGAATAPAGQPASPGAATASQATSGSPACQHITTALCEKQNNSMLALSGAYVAACVLVVALLRAWMNKRGASTPLVRFMLPMFLGSAGAAALVGLDPGRGADLACCLESATFKSQILLQDSAMGRAMLFGAAPAAVLFLLVVIVVGIIRK
jgi:hypothetical protein